MKLLNSFNTYLENLPGIVYGSVAGVVTVVSIIHITLDRDSSLYYKGGLLAGILTLDSYALKLMQEDQEEEFEQLKKADKRELLNQATVGILDTPETVPSIQPSILATDYEDPSQLAKTIQTIMQSMGIESSFRGLINAPRFNRVLLQHHIGSPLPSETVLGKRLWVGLTQFALEEAPIIGFERGLLSIDIPKDPKEFQGITYSQVKDTIRSFLSVPNRRIIGLNTNYEIVHQEVDQHQAFMIIGGKPGSGKSIWLTSVCIETLLSDPNCVAYCVDLKEGTFSDLEGCKQLYDYSVAYDMETAAEYIQALYDLMNGRKKEAQSLKGQEKIEWFNSLNTHYLFFDEYRDDDSYIKELELIFKEARSLKIRVILATQKLNKTSRTKGATVSTMILANTQSRLCFLVEDELNSQQILGNSEGAKLLGKGDCFYKSDVEQKIQRLQTIWYKPEEIVELCRGLEYVDQPVERPFIPEFSSHFKILENSEKPKLPTIKPPTVSWQVLELLEKHNRPLSLDQICRGIPGYSRKSLEIREILEKMIEAGEVVTSTSANYRGVVYSSAKGMGDS